MKFYLSKENSELDAIDNIKGLKEFDMKDIIYICMRDGWCQFNSFQLKRFLEKYIK